MKYWHGLVVSLFLVGMLVTQADAASKYNGKYSGNLYYKSANPVNGGSCYSQSQIPYIGLLISSVVQKGSRMSGYNNTAQGLIKMSGTTNSKGFRLNFKYTDPYYGYRYVYKITFSSVTRARANVAYNGVTYSGTTGCRYVYSGKLTHSK